jgi:hypothetical protein
MRRYRQRRRDDLRCLTVQLRETEIEALIHKGLLQFETRHSENEIKFPPLTERISRCG